MTVPVAERYPFPLRLRDQLRTLASNEGVIHANSEGELYGLAPFTAIDLGTIEDHGAHRAALEQLRASRVLGVEGPALSAPRIHAAFPFDPSIPTIGLLPAVQVTIVGDKGWATILGATIEEERERYQALIDRLSSHRDDGPFPSGPVKVVEQPDPEGYESMVSSAVALIDDGVLAKVVLSRTVTVTAERELNLALVLSTMAEREPSCTLFALPVGSSRYIGASPELLLKLDQGKVTSHPLAGTIPLSTHDAAEVLSTSTKDLEEHRLVVIDIAERLADAVDDLNVPLTPTLVSLRTVAHLGTTISAKLDPTSRLDCIDLLARIHPTPAISGVPRRESRTLIDELEDSPRGLFGGAVGWVNGSGDGEWVLGIRGALIANDVAIVRAGAGIVAGSTPSGEAEETRVKLSSILDAIEPGSSSQLKKVG